MFTFSAFCIPEVDLVTNTIVLATTTSVPRPEEPRGMIAACAWLNAVRYDAPYVYFYEYRGASQRLRHTFVFGWNFTSLNYELYARNGAIHDGLIASFFLTSKWYAQKAFNRTMKVCPPKEATHYEIKGGLVDKHNRWSTQKLTYTIMPSSAHILRLAKAKNRRNKQDAQCCGT